MVAYNFKAQFVSLIESGQKCQTIRALGKRRHAREGDPLSLYTGMRTKGCRKLMEEICTDAQPIKIMGHYLEGSLTGVSVYLADSPTSLSAEEIERLAQSDGFASIKEFAEFFADRLPFDGVLIKW